MVRAVEQEFGAAGDGTELPDDQPVVVDRVMVQHIVLLKFRWVIDKVIVHRVVANLNAGFGDHML